MIFTPFEVLTISHPISIASIHLLFLGVITMGMIGALFQMQSVLGGASIPSPLGNSVIIHILLTIGILALVGAFTLHWPELFMIAGVLIGGGVVYFAQILLPLLFGKITHDTLKGMRFAIFSLLIAAILGIVMATSYANESFGEYHTIIRTSHYSIALIGWVAALIVYVAFQVIEMFYVTTPYSDWCKHNVKRVLGSSLLLKIIGLFLALPYTWIFDTVIVLVLIGFATTTLKRLQIRKRRVSDVSIWFWMAGNGLLMIALITYMSSIVTNYAPLDAVSLIAFGLFALAIILGMMGKIVPFLVWFHLSSSGFMDAPIMSHIIPQKRLKLTFWLFVTASFFALISPLYPLLLMASGVFSGAMFALVLFNLITALRLYSHTLKHGTKFSFET
jgi:hypothetical protein